MRLDLSRRSDGELLREFTALVVRDRRSTAELLAYVSEVQARRLYAAQGYSSMYAYCVGELHMSEDMAWKRTRVARLARRFPVVLDMIADGRLHVSGVIELVPYRNAREFPGLLEAAAHRTRAGIELLLAQRFPQPDAPTSMRPVKTSGFGQGMAPGPVEPTHVSMGFEAGSQISPASASDSAVSTTADAALPGRSAPEPPAPPPFEQPAGRARVKPLAPQRFAIQVTVGQATHDKLRRAQELLGHRVPPGDLEQVLDRALDALLRQLENEKFAATEKPRRAKQRSSAGKRHVPAEVKRAVYERDGGRCAFVSDSGHRCEERRDLQYDHVRPFARGGEATVSGIRLLCPAHNQLAAERVFGAGFMERKRREAGPRVNGGVDSQP